MDEAEAKRTLETLRSAVALLASPAEQQLDHLRKIGGSNDELGLELDDVVGTIPSLVATGHLTPAQARAIEAVDSQVAAISGGTNTDLWADDGIEHAPQWREIRALAAAALEELGRNS